MSGRLTFIAVTLRFRFQYTLLKKKLEMAVTKKSGKKKAVEKNRGNIYGLLVGINDYQKVRKLKCCVNDINRWEEYLIGLPDRKVHLQKLTDADASRKNIIASFEKHLSKAGKDDTVFFVYSGHGTQEDAADYWGESDKRLECLVCHDGGATKSSDFLLTDKDQRFLIRRLYDRTKAHIVLVFDCCNSGDNTRGALQIAASEKQARARFIVTNRPSRAFEQRSWKDFAFAKEIKEPDGKINLHSILPEVPHVAISACQSNETAIERDGEGVFTNNMLTLLDNAGSNLSYRNLEIRIKQVMRFTEVQNPEVYAPLLYASILDAGFLNRGLQDVSSAAEVSYNPSVGWQLNRGALHNVQAGNTIGLYAPGDRENAIDAEVKKVFIDYSLVEPSRAINKRKTWYADVKNMLQRKIVLQLDNWHGHPEDTRKLVQEIMKRAGGYYEISTATGTGIQTDFELTIRNGEVIITHPDNEFKPLIRPLPLIDAKDIPAVVDALIHMAKWYFIKELQNKDKSSAFRQFPVTVDVYQQKATKFTKLSNSGNSVKLSLSKKGDQWKSRLKIKLTSNHTKTLYVAALYLDKHFMSFPDLMPDQVKLLDPGESVFLAINDNPELELELGDLMRQYNWQSATEYIQVLASEENFAADALRLHALPAPYVLSDADVADKGIKLEPEEDQEIRIKKWQSQLLTMVMPNPVYNVISPKMLRQLMEYEETAYYAAGIYYDVAPDETGEPVKLVLKKGIKVPEEEKTILDDIKLFAANTFETLQRKRLYNRLKNTGRTHIVAEGDSWFQYPILVKDTLDHLYKLYAIRSYAEAGDTLENYMKKREYLKGLKSEKPVFFLISGGGNDILGKQFRGFLRDSADNAETSPARYLKPEFFKKLEQLQQWYEDMFGEILKLYPNLYIITQSYDYVIPVDTTKEPKKTSWLGKYMIEKGISDQEERKRLIAFMVDEFNSRLQNAVNQHKNRVFYVNVRGLTRSNQWFDEIHPNNEGFAAIADQFVTIIENVKKK